MRRIIPCLDVRDGRVVKGVKFQGLRDAGDPVELAHQYEQQGADELVFLDISATPAGRRTAHDTVRKVRRVLAIPLTVGGGIRTADDAAAILDGERDARSAKQPNHCGAKGDPSHCDHTRVESLQANFDPEERGTPDQRDARKQPPLGPAESPEV